MKRSEPFTVSIDPDKFVIVPNWIMFHPGLTPHDVRVWAGLRMFASNATMMCNPSQDTIAEICGVSLRAVRNALGHLEAVGCLEVFLEAKGGRRHNHYHLLTDPVDNSPKPVDSYRHEVPVTTNPPARGAGTPARGAASGAARGAGELETISKLRPPRCETCGRIWFAGHRCGDGSS